jgi:hypothetical protein
MAHLWISLLDNALPKSNDDDKSPRHSRTQQPQLQLLCQESLALV